MAKEERKMTMTDMLLYRSESGEFARALWEIQQTQNEGIVLLASGRKYKVHHEGRPMLAMHRGKRCVFMEGRVQTTFFGGYDVLTVVRVQDDRPHFWMQVTPHNTPFCESIRYSGWFDSPSKSMKQLFDELGHEFASLAKGDAAKAFGSTLAEYQKILLVSSKFGTEIKALMEKAEEENKAEEEQEAAKKQPVIGAIAAAAASTATYRGPIPEVPPPAHSKRLKHEAPGVGEEGETDVDSEFHGVEQLKSAVTHMASVPQSRSAQVSKTSPKNSNGAIFPTFAQPLSRSISSSSLHRSVLNSTPFPQMDNSSTSLPVSVPGGLVRSSSALSASGEPSQLGGAAGLHLIANVLEEHEMLKKLSTAFPELNLTAQDIKAASSLVDQSVVMANGVTAEKFKSMRQFASGLLALCPSLRDDPLITRKLEAASTSVLDST